MNIEEHSYKEKNLGYMSDRSLSDYLELLDVPKEELDEAGTLILDLGAGAKQGLAKEARLSSLKSRIISIDPRLGLSPEEDLNLSATDKEKRLEGRRNPEPLTLAAVSEAIPLKDNSIEHIYAVFSVPYYLESFEEIEQTLNEMIRIVKPGGTIKAFPLLTDNIPLVKKILDQKEKLVGYSIELKGEKVEGEKDERDGLLVIHKKGN